MTNPGSALAALRKTHAITCRVCGAPAVKRDLRALYCSAKCRQQARRDREKLRLVNAFEEEAGRAAQWCNKFQAPPKAYRFALPPAAFAYVMNHLDEWFDRVRDYQYALHMEEINKPED